MGSRCRKGWGVDGDSGVELRERRGCELEEIGKASGRGRYSKTTEQMMVPYIRWE